MKIQIDKTNTLMYIPYDIYIYDGSDRNARTYFKLTLLDAKYARGRESAPPTIGQELRFRYLKLEGIDSSSHIDTSMYDGIMEGLF